MYLFAFNTKYVNRGDEYYFTFSNLENFFISLRSKNFFNVALDVFFSFLIELD